MRTLKVYGVCIGSLSPSNFAFFHTYNAVEARKRAVLYKKQWGVKDSVSVIVPMTMYEYGQENFREIALERGREKLGY